MYIYYPKDLLFVNLTTRVMEQRIDRQSDGVRVVFWKPAPHLKTYLLRLSEAPPTTRTLEARTWNKIMQLK